MLRIAATIACLLIPAGALCNPQREASLTFPRCDLASWSKAHPETRDAILGQMREHGARFPQVARDLHTLQVRKDGFVGSQVAVTWDDGTPLLVKIRFKQAWVSKRQKDAKRKATHEFGHALAHWMRFHAVYGSEAWLQREFKSNRQEDREERFAESFEALYHEPVKGRRLGAAKVEAFLKGAFPQVPVVVRSEDGSDLVEQP